MFLIIPLFLSLGVAFGIGHHVGADSVPFGCDADMGNVMKDAKERGFVPAGGQNFNDGFIVELANPQTGDLEVHFFAPEAPPASAPQGLVKVDECQISSGATLLHYMLKQRLDEQSAASKQSDL